MRWGDKDALWDQALAVRCSSSPLPGRRLRLAALKRETAAIDDGGRADRRSALRNQTAAIGRLIEGIDAELRAAPEGRAPAATFPTNSHAPTRAPDPVVPVAPPAPTPRRRARRRSSQAAAAAPARAPVAAAKPGVPAWVANWWGFWRRVWQWFEGLVKLPFLICWFLLTAVFRLADWACGWRLSGGARRFQAAATEHLEYAFGPRVWSRLARGRAWVMGRGSAASVIK